MQTPNLDRFLTKKTVFFSHVAGDRWRCVLIPHTIPVPERCAINRKKRFTILPSKHSPGQPANASSNAQPPNHPTHIFIELTTAQQSANAQLPSTTSQSLNNATTQQSPNAQLPPSQSLNNATTQQSPNAQLPLANR